MRVWEKSNRLFLSMALSLVTGLTIDEAHAASIETLLMPGEVSQAHAKLEEQCSNCHDKANRERQTALCLSCHKEVASDINTHTGFHGRLPNIDRAQCKGCHSDHLGRKADIVRLSPTNFNHKFTDFELRGQHTVTACEGCHKPNKPYRDASQQCVACHQSDDPHQGKLGKECQSCHRESSWPQAAFDHNKTAFLLSGAHNDKPCMACHFGNRYKGTPQQCVSCHAPDDAHRGSRGAECSKCHNTTNWKTATFDHTKETGFALEGSHAELTCVACHKSGQTHDKIPNSCYGCHRSEDAHAGRFNTDCASCHNNTNWNQSKFDHLQTQFPLMGKHASVKCHSCHTANVKQQTMGKECVQCHRATDAHATQLGTQCDRCHSVNGWKNELTFDHDLTAFPLVGLHVSVPCALCHTSKTYKDIVKSDPQHSNSATCIGCHKTDDVHKGGLGKDCHTCHTPNGFGIWEFDHAKQTDFALKGAHAKLQCANCHRDPAHSVKLSSECMSCHQSDDPHLGQFGRQCQRCHNTNSFKGVRLR
jgi:hypothetical protein